MAKQTGKVMDYDKFLGHGHIEPDDGTEKLIMYRANILAHLGDHQGIGEGKKVEFHVKSDEDERYREATNVTGPGGAPISPTFRFSLSSGRRRGVEGGGSRGCAKCKAAIGPVVLCIKCGFYSDGGEVSGEGGSRGGSGGSV